MKRVLKHGFHLTRWTFALVILLTMAFLILGRVFVSYIEDSTAEAVARLSDALGVPVSVSSVDTEWRGLGPSLVLNGVSLGQGDDLSTVDMLAVKPDVLSSLRNLSLVWSRFEANGLDLDIDELASGHWQVAGIGVEGNSSGGFLEKMLLESRNVSITDASVHLTSLNGTRVNLRVHELSLANVLGFHRLRLNADFGSEENQLNFIAELNGTAVRFAELDGLAHLQISGRDVSGFYEYFRGKFWPDVQLEYAEKPIIHAQFWATLRSRQEIQVQGDVQFEQIPGAIFGQQAEAANAQASLVAIYSEDRLQADLIEPVVRVADEEMILPSLRLSRRIDEQMVFYGMQLPGLDVERLLGSAANVGVIPEDLLEKLLPLELQGEIEQLYLEVPANEPQAWSMTANLQSFGMNSFNRAPAVRNLTGKLGLDHFGGRIEVDASDFGILYPQVYDHWLTHQSVRGLVGWELDAENRFVRVYSDHIEVESVQGSVFGAFATNIPLFPDYPTGVDLTLYLGMENSGVEHVSGLLPERLPQSLQDWLNQSLIAGTVPQAGMIYRGSTRPGTEDHRTIQLHIEAENAELAFLPRWPNLTDAGADVWVSDTDVYARSSRAGILDLTLGDIEVWVDSGQAPQEEAISAQRRIRILGRASGPANSALDLVRTTNLRDRVGASLDNLDLQGGMQSTIALGMPLSSQIQRQDIKPVIEVSLSGNQLDITDLDLTLANLVGTLHYDNSGLHSETLMANIWDSPLNLQIREDMEQAVVHIAGEGELEAEAIIDWLGFDLLEGIQGSSMVIGELDISTDSTLGKPHIFEFTSEMTQVASGLPQPLSKAPGQPAPLRVRLEKSDQLLTRVDWQLAPTEDDGELKSFQLEMVSEGGKDNVKTASLAYQTDLPESETGVAKGNIQMPDLDLQPWIELFGSENAEAGASYGTLFGLRPELEFEVGNLSIGKANFGHVSALLDYQDDAWNLDLQTDYASGTFQDFRAEDRLSLLSLSHLDVDAYLTATAGLSGQTELEVESPFDPREIPELQFELESVVYKAADRGHWKGEFRSTGSGLWIGNLEGGLGSALLSQEEGESSIFWGVDAYGQYTEANFTFDYTDIGDLFKILNLRPSMSSSSGLLYGSLHWQGAPFEFSDSALNGIMGVDAIEGEFFTGNNSVNPLLKTIGLFNAGAWTRRLRLDFKDVTAEGTYYDRLVGDFILEDNLVSTLTPVTVNMSSGSMQFDGEVDLDRDLLDAKLVVTLPARQNMTWVAALVGGLPAAAGVWLASKVFDEELDSLSSVSYRVTGPMADPRIEAERVFESTITN